MQKLPVINIAYKEKCFPVFTNVHGSINLPDSGGKAELMDGTNVQLEPLHCQVLFTWKNRVVSQTANVPQAPQNSRRARKKLSCTGL